jgi:hypothetical protein
MFEVIEGDVVLYVLHRLQATQAVTWPSGGTARSARSCSMEINGSPRPACMTRMSAFAPEEVLTITPMRTLPVIGDLVPACRSTTPRPGNTANRGTGPGDGPRTCYEARRQREGKKDLAARFGGITLRQDRRAVIRDPAPAPAPYPRKELVRRLLKRECELCETGTTVTVHQVTGLKQLREPGPGRPARAALMAKIRRKTLIVCAPCHNWIHANPAAHAA